MYIYKRQLLHLVGHNDSPNSSQLRKGTNSLIILAAWTTWKHRNAVIFDGATPSHAHLTETIKLEGARWTRAGARDLTKFSM